VGDELVFSTRIILFFFAGFKIEVLGADFIVANDDEVGDFFEAGGADFFSEGFVTGI